MAAEWPVPPTEISRGAGFEFGAVGAEIHVSADGTPIYLLRRWFDAGRAGAVPRVGDVIGRYEEMESLHRWRTTGPRLAARWLHGPDGAGKGRLAAHFAARAQADGWLTVVAAHGPGSVVPPPGSQDLRTDTSHGLLLLVDHADRWPAAHLTWLFGNALVHRPGLPARILMLARSADGWPAVRAALAAHAAGTSTQSLDPPLAPGPA